MPNAVIKKLTCKGTLWQVFYLSEAQNPILLSPHTLYMCIKYTNSHRKGGRRGDLNREKIRGTMLQ